MQETFEYFKDRPIHFAIAAICLASCVFFITDCTKNTMKAEYEYRTKVFSNEK